MQSKQSLTTMQVHSPGTIRFFDLADQQTSRTRRIFLSIPPGQAPESGWPALVLLDGNAMIATGADILRAQAPYPASTNLGWGLLIGIGYPTEDAFSPFQRSWDLTPPPGRIYPSFEVGGLDAKTGGAEEFARFLLDEALPAVAKLLPVDHDRTSIFGHSFGGLFALWLLFTQPTAFRNWIAASPSIAWEDGNLMRFFNALDPAAVRGKVYLSAGEWEGDVMAPFQTAGFEREKRLKTAAETNMMSAAKDLAARLQPSLGGKVGFEIFADATHMSTLPAALNRALHVAFGLWHGSQVSG